MLKFLKPLSFIPAIVMMYVIFSFSSQDGTTSAQLSYKVSYTIVETGCKILGEELEPWQIDSIATRFHGIVRKIAHMTEYFILAVTVAFPLYVYGLRGIWLMIVAGLFCVAFACGDEYHQSYVDGRGPSVRDVGIDSIGVLFGIILVRIVGWTGRNTIFRPFTKKKKKGEENHQENPGSGYPNGRYPNNGYPNNGYPNARYQNSGYQNNGYQNGGYQNNGYQNNGYQNNGYPNGGYPNRAYQNGNYSSGQSEPVYSNSVCPNGNYVQGSYTNAGYQQNARAEKNYEKNYDSSDSLSEDMSLKKLVHDIKTQKKDSGSRSSDINEIDLDK